MRTLPVARTRRPLRVALAVAGVAVLAGLVLLRPDGSRPEVEPAGPASDGRVVALRTEACPDTVPAAGITCTTAEVRLEGGGVVDATTDVRASPGDRVVVRETAAGAVVVGHDRSGPSMLLAAVAAIVLLVVARVRGLRAAAALAAAVAVVAAWAVPAVLDGRSTPAVAAVVAAVVALALTVVVRADPVAQVAALAAVVVGVAGAVVVDVVGDALSVDPLASIGGAALVGAGVALLAVASVEATWALDDLAPDAGWRKVAGAGRRRSAPAAAAVTTAFGTAVVAMTVLALPRFVQGSEALVDVLDGEALAPALAWLGTTFLVVPLVSPVASALAAWVAVREAAGASSSDPRNFRSRGERAMWEG